MAKMYTIRRRDGSQSEPFSVDDIKKKIRSGELSESDELSLHPTQFSSKVAEYPEFEGEFHEEKTLLFDRNNFSDPSEEKTRLFGQVDVSKVEDLFEKKTPAIKESANEPVPVDEFADPVTQKSETIVFERPKEFLSKGESEERPRKSKFGLKVPKKSFLILIMLALVAYEMLFEDEDPAQKERAPVVMVPVRPQLPSGGSGKVDPEKSVKIYNEALRPYMEDTVQGYRRAVDGFQIALRLDPQNVKALAMLASSYLNLIDSSNKDENTFSVINKLIDLSRLKQLELVETLLAEVEFLAASRRYDAAIQRLVDYSKVSGKFDPVLYYYLGWLYSLKGEYGNAMKYLNFIPSSSLPMPRLYYLRGYLHEENNEFDEAVAEYKRALSLNPKHAKSFLGLVRIAEKKGELKQALRFVEFLTGNPSYLSPPEYVKALIYRSKLELLYNQPDQAIKSLKNAINIEPKNEDLKLEYYSLLSSSNQNSKYKSIAQMYALVLDGERNLKAGKTHEAISVLLQAQDTFSKSSVPYEKMGDLFSQTGEYERAQSNYKRALEIDPKAAEIAIKLIDALIRNHEWEEAQKYLAKYRSHPKLKSSIDRLAGDLAFHQKSYDQAIGFYRKAMARDTIDTEVYSSYANALSELDQCKDAQFFYSIAQRLDPFNYAAILGAAKCLLKTDNINVAVGRVQEELAKLPRARPDLLVGIAELYLLAQDPARALQFTQQAKDIDADYPDSYRIEGDIYAKDMLNNKDMKKKALESYKSYSDRKVSDPYGYIQRFDIFLKDSNFESAAEELTRISEVSPRYPELHYRRAQMFSKMGRVKDALTELELELKNNPRLVKALVEQGNIYVRASNPDEAMKSFVKAMEIDPQSAAAKIGAGYVNYLKRQFPSAIALYQSALAIDRGNPDTYKKLGMAYRDSGDAGKAATAFQSYLDLSPDAPDRADFEQYRRQ